MTQRRDRRGRRIGFNWWREMNCTLLLDADLAWQADREAVAIGYATEMAEYAAVHTRPTLKAFLIGNRGMMQNPDAA